MYVFVSSVVYVLTVFFCLLLTVNLRVQYAMASKRKSDTSAPQKKRKVIDLEQKINIVKMYECGQSLSDISRNLSMSVSTINTIVKDRDRENQCFEQHSCM